MGMEPREPREAREPGITCGGAPYGGMEPTSPRIFVSFPAFVVELVPALAIAFSVVGPGWIADKSRTVIFHSCFVQVSINREEW